MIYKMIYCSRASSSVDVEEFKRILSKAQTKNAERGLTGVLLFNSKIFLQVLEGPIGPINELYTTLCGDDRHSDLRILKYEPILARQWPSWSMSFAPISKKSRAVYMKYSPSNRFDPYEMLGDAAEQMIMELTDNSMDLGEKVKPVSEPEKGIIARIFS